MEIVTVVVVDGGENMFNGVFYNCGGDGGGPLVVLVGRVKENVLKG